VVIAVTVACAALIVLLNRPREAPKVDLTGKAPKVDLTGPHLVKVTFATKAGQAWQIHSKMERSAVTTSQGPGNAEEKASKGVFDGVIRVREAAADGRPLRAEITVDNFKITEAGNERTPLAKGAQLIFEVQGLAKDYRFSSGAAVSPEAKDWLKAMLFGAQGGLRSDQEGAVGEDSMQMSAQYGPLTSG
jgi:hypothetical protein